MRMPDPRPRAGHCSGLGLFGARVDELAVEAGFAFEEALGMEALAQPVQLVVEVVADLMQERAKKGPKGYDLTPLGGTHPN